MDQERRYLDYLQEVNATHIFGDQLWMETVDGRALIFTAQESADHAGPVED